MGFRLPGIANAKKSLSRSLSAPKTLDIPKGYFAVYVGESQKKRFVIPISYLNHPSFQDLLSRAEEEFGYDHPMGGITIPCKLTDSTHEEAVLLGYEGKKYNLCDPQAACEGCL